jgi:hypothetical protein
MPPHSIFKWSDLYYQYVKSIDRSAESASLPSVKVRRDYGVLSIAEAKMLDLRETGGKREVVKAIFKTDHGFIVVTTLEGHITGSIYVFENR